jgi:hypothetical protein
VDIPSDVAAHDPHGVHLAQDFHPTRHPAENETSLRQHPGTFDRL